MLRPPISIDGSPSPESGHGSHYGIGGGRQETTKASHTRFARDDALAPHQRGYSAIPNLSFKSERLIQILGVFLFFKKKDS
jgi:hypothetical protein